MADVNPPTDRLPDLLSRLGQLGLTCIVKVDGERWLEGAGPWTVLVSGGSLAPEFVRRDGRDLQTCLGQVLAEIEQRLAGVKLLPE